jgi:hypothetical protein
MSTCLQVLRKRRGKTLNRRIILKSYLARAADPSLPPGTPDVRQAEGALLLLLLLLCCCCAAVLLFLITSGSLCIPTWHTLVAACRVTYSCFFV